MMITVALFGLLMVGLGYAQVRAQQKAAKGLEALSPAARKRFRIVFPAMMGGLLVLLFIAVFLLRPPA